jgi:hypothetical protein
MNNLSKFFRWLWAEHENFQDVVSGIIIISFVAVFITTLSIWNFACLALWVLLGFFIFLIQGIKWLEDKWSEWKEIK